MQIIVKADERPRCTGVSWGHFSMKSALNEDLGTSSLGSCFAFIVLDPQRDQVFFAHVASDAETKWIIQHLLKPPTDVAERETWKPRYYAFTGEQPQNTTEKRIKLIDGYLGNGLLERRDATTGAVILQGSNWRDNPTFYFVKDIDALNLENYKLHTKAGMLNSGGMLPMPGSDFISEI